MASAGALWKDFLPIKLTVPLFNVARRPRPAPHIELTLSKPVAPFSWRLRRNCAAFRVTKAAGPSF